MSECTESGWEVSSNGDKWWYKDGDLHRDGGPAFEWADGTKEWYQNGELHREDGPAIVYPDGSVEYWIDSVRMTEMEYFVRYGIINNE